MNRLHECIKLEKYLLIRSRAINRCRKKPQFEIELEVEEIAQRCRDRASARSFINKSKSFYR